MEQHDILVSGGSVPVLLTVEEAGALLRIGRTKAYAMAREWRETEGRSGLPVVDLGHVLRVPRQALEDLIGADLSTATIEGPASEKSVAETTVSRNTADREPSDREPVNPRPNRNPQNRIADQLDLFDSRVRTS